MILRSLSFSAIAALLLGSAAGQVRTAPAMSAPQTPVSYASASEVNTLLAQLDATSQATSAALGRIRIGKWKTDSGTKQQVQANSDSIQRNLQAALPALIAAVRNNPDDVAASFKLYRNLDALYDVMSNVTESAGAFGSRSDYQELNENFNHLDSIRRSLADRLDNLATQQQNEVVRLRSQVRGLQAGGPSAPPKKVIVDDNEPVKKTTPRKRKPAKPKEAAAGNSKAVPSPTPPQ